MLLHVIRPIPDAATTFVRAHEGCRLTVYLDSVGVPTIGYGHTGPEVVLGLEISQDQADSYLAQDLATAARRLEAKVGEACVQELTENQYAALLSFVFNLGTGSPDEPEWRIWGLLRAQEFDQVPSEIIRFCYAGGHKLAGLVERRADEVKLWSTDEPGSLPSSMSSGSTRAIDTPPAQRAVNPLAKSKQFIAACVGTCVTTASAVAPTIKGGLDKASDAIAPYVGKSAVLAGVADHLALASAAVAVLTVALMALHHQGEKAQ